MSVVPLSTQLPPEALRVLAKATRHETPCGEGQTVWHVWGTGEPLVLLHGGSGSWTHWLRNVEALSTAGRRIVVPDLPGFGDSTRPPHGHDADAVVEPLVQGLRTLVGDEPCDVVGFSFGGLVAGLMAAQHPGRMRRLVLVGAPGLGLRSQRLPLVPWREQADPKARDEAHRSNLATLMLHRPQSIDTLAVALQAANVTRDRMRGRTLALTDVLARTLHGIRCPVDAIYGEHDALYRTTLAELASVLKEGPTFGELVLVPEAGHWVQFEEAAAFNREVMRLLGRR